MQDPAAAVTVILVSYNSAEVLGAALASLPRGVRAVVSDNGSTDGSDAIARSAGADVVHNGANLGFGTACNRGAARAETPFLLFLNPDARLQPEALVLLLSELDRRPEAAAAGPLLDDGTGPLMPRQRHQLSPDGPTAFAVLPEEPVEVAFLSGAAILIRREVFEAIGGFDERIFLYLEDDDLCLRILEAGHRLMLVPAARVVHHQGRSVPRAAAGVRMRNRHTMASTRYLAAKHGLALDCARLRRKAWRRLAQAVFLADRQRIAANIGRLEGLDAWPFARRRGLQSPGE